MLIPIPQGMIRFGTPVVLMDYEGLIIKPVPGTQEVFVFIRTDILNASGGEVMRFNPEDLQLDLSDARTKALFTQWVAEEIGLTGGPYLINSEGALVDTNGNQTEVSPETHPDIAKLLSQLKRPTRG